MNRSDCWIVIAARNEQRRIGAVVRSVRRQGFPVVVVDDGSSDDTARCARPAVVLTHVVNLGKGAAMKTGAEYALGRGAKALIFMDGDGQHDPHELDLFLGALKRGAQIVFGARREMRQMPWERRLGAFILRTMIRHVYNIVIHDPLNGYRAMTAGAYRKVRWESRDYSVESEMIARTGKAMLPNTEVTISTIYHEKYKGMTALHGVRIMLQLLWWRMTH
jgi:glycosyltransferase involved in cell wall biosynthesis